MLNDDGVLANDTDPNPSDIPNLQAFINIAPQHASLFQLNRDGTFVYRHDGSNTFEDSFTYIVDDGHGGSSVAEVRITLTQRPQSIWQNQFLPEDVNNDGFVTPLDALIVINSLNVEGSRTLPNPAIPPNAPPPFYDTNGDGDISPVDALMVINYLNEPNNQGEGEGAPVGVETNEFSSAVALPDHATDARGLGYGEALANYVLQREDVGSSRPLRTRLENLVERPSIDVDAYRQAFETALATVGDDDQGDFASSDSYDLLAQDSLHDLTDVDDAVFSAEEDWI